MYNYHGASHLNDLHSSDNINHLIKINLSQLSTLPFNPRNPPPPLTKKYNKQQYSEKVVINFKQKATSIPNSSLLDPSVLNETSASNISATMQRNGYCQVEQITMSTILFGMHIRIATANNNADIRSGVQTLIRVVKEVDRFLLFLSTIVKSNVNRVY